MIIGTINIDSSLCNLIDLLHQMSQLNISLMAVQCIPKLKETNLKGIIHECNQELEVLLKPTNNNPRITKHWHGFIYNKTKISAEIIAYQDNNQKASLLGISAKMNLKHQLQQFNLVSVYTKPLSNPKDMESIRKEINNITINHGKSRLIILADTNTTNILWASSEDVKYQIHYGEKEETLGNQHYVNIRRQRSRAWGNIIQTNRLTCYRIPSELYTFEDHQVKTKIDIIAAGNKAVRFWTGANSIRINESAKHRAVIITSKDEKPATKTTNYTIRSIVQYNKIKPKYFDRFRQNSDLMLLEWEKCHRDDIIKRLNNVTTLLQQTLLMVQDKVTTVRRRPKSNTSKQQRIVKLNNKISKRNTRRRKVPKDIKISYWKKTKQTKSTTKMDKLWQDIRNLTSAKNDVISGVSTQHDLERIANEKFPEVARNEAEIIQQTLKQNQTKNTNLISSSELANAIHSVRNKTYKGADGVHMQTIVKSSKYIDWALLNIVNMSLFTGYTPRCLLNTKGTLIPKKAANKYRIVHITCATTAIIERIILHKLERVIEKNQKYNPCQFGFLPRRSRHDIVTRIIERTMKNTNKLGAHAKTVLIGLDIEGAFDNVNQNNLANKIYQDFANEPISGWIIDFILNRKIRIRSGNLVSNTRRVCRGVPQGSVLGPILWNYVINQIDASTCQHQKYQQDLEILAYADDMVIIYTGKSHQILQEALNTLETKLAEMNLRVCPEKSTCMHITLKGQTRSKYTFKLNQQNIPITNCTRVLGTPITNKLSLDTKDEQTLSKVCQNASTLHMTNRLGIVKRAAYWRVIIESYIQSILCLSNLPMLAIDTKAREWSDQMTYKCIKYIFGWGPNVPNKTITLLLGIRTTEQLVKRFLLKATSDEKEIELENAYQTLHELFNKSGNQTTLLNQVSDTNTIVFRKKRPRYPIPESIIPPSQPCYQVISDEILNDLNIPETLNQHKWVILENRHGGIAALVQENGNISKIMIVKHTRNTICNYFDTMATVKRLCLDTNVRDKVMHFSVNSSVFLALSNASNRDWRIINLRNQLHHKEWEVRCIETNEYLYIRYLVEQAINITKQQEPWQRKTEVTTHKSNWPPTSDYERNVIARNILEKEQTHQTNQLHSAITRAIEPSSEIWQQINASKVNTHIMLALSGISCNEQTNQLYHANRIQNQTDHEYECRRCNKRSTTNQTLHNLYECTIKKEKLKGAITKLNNQTNQPDLKDSIGVALKKPRLHTLVLNTIRLAADISAEGLK